MRRTSVRTTAVLATLAILAGVSPQTTAAPPGGEKVALLVGVRDYDRGELRSLKYTERDVDELESVLREAGYNRVVLLTQAEGARRSRCLPTARNIGDELNSLLETRRRTDTVLIAFSGHGVQFRGEKEHYFCPMDARLADRATLVSLTDLYDRLQRCPAAVKLLLVDACRDDPQADLSKGLGRERLESVTRPQAVRPPGGVAALFSASEGQRSFESDRLRHGVFFHFVIRGLRGEADSNRDSVVAVNELAEYTQQLVPNHVKDEISLRAEQVPNLVSNLSGSTPIVAVAPAPRPEPTPTPTPPPPPMRVVTRKLRPQEVFSPDKRSRVFVNLMGQVEKRDANTDRFQWRWSSPSDRVEFLGFAAPDRVYIATASRVLVLDGTSGQRMWQRDFVLAGPAEDAGIMAVDIAGATLKVSFGDGSAMQFNGRSGRQLE